MTPHLKLIVLLVGIFGATSCVGEPENLWRVNQELLSNEARQYSTRLPIEVDFLGDDHDFVQWVAPAHCAAVDPRSISTKIKCSMAGLPKVKMVWIDEGEQVVEARPMIMKNSPLCYEWYVLSLAGSVDRNGDLTDIILRVWIWDPIYASQEEIKQTATTPSTFSLTLSKVFAEKGQEPLITELLPDPRAEWEWTNMTFDSSNGYWEFTVIVTKSLTRRVLVTGRPNIAAHGCFIRDTKVLVYWPKQDEVQSLLTSSGTQTLRGTSGITLVISDPCDQTMAYLIMSGRCVMTVDGFKSTADVTVPTGLVSDEALNVTDIVVTSTMSVFLLEDGSVLSQDHFSGSFSRFEVPDNTPLLAVQGKEWCQQSSTYSYENDLFLGWTDDIVYIWRRDRMIANISTEQLGANMLPNPFWLDEEEHLEVTIESAGFTAEPMEAAIMVKLSDDHESILAFIKWDIAASTMVSARSFFFKHKTGHVKAISFVNVFGSEENLIFWDEMGVYYSYSQGSEISEMPLFNHPDESGVEPEIKQLVLTLHGYIVAVSSTNVLYTSQVYQEYLIQHFPLAASESDLAIYANHNDEVFMLHFESSELMRVRFALKPEIKTIVDHKDHEACQYIYFQQCPLYRVYYLDVRDEAVVWAELIHTAEKYNDIKTIITIASKVDIKETVQTDFYPGRRSVKKELTLKSSFTFSQPGNYSEAVDKASGLVSLEMRPERLGVGCPSPHNMVANLEMGCPPNRHIRVRKPTECEEIAPFTVDSKAYMLPNGEEPTEGKVIQFDKLLYGCPITVSVKETFKPLVELYDDDVLVENMTANFVMWEDSWRTDFDYTLTMQKAGCLQEAQTWDSMRSRTGAEAPIKDIWGPHNYESCFIYKLTELALLRRSSYQVLNQSGENEIKWLTTGDENLFLFSVQVVDPYYSFCNLETQFGVIVMGRGVVADPREAVLRISLGTFAGITGSLLLISYFVYRRYHIQEIEADILGYGHHGEDSGGGGDTGEDSKDT